LVCIIAARIGKDRLHVFDEVVLKDSDTFEMAEVLSRKYPGIPVYPDPAGSPDTHQAQNQTIKY
jgi:hypothetical protein